MAIEKRISRTDYSSTVDANGALLFVRKTETIDIVEDGTTIATYAPVTEITMTEVIAMVDAYKAANGL